MNYFFYYSLSFGLLIFFIIANLNFLHWKTFYQTSIGQIFSSILIFLIARKKFHFHINKEYFFLVYFIFLGAWITASTEFFYKLGRQQNSLDIFRYFCGFIPIIFFFEIIKKDFASRGIFRFITFSILLFTSISFNYTYFKIPELGFFLTLPILLVIIEQNFSFTNPQKISLTLLIVLFFVHALVTYSSFSSLIIYSSLFLASFVFLKKTWLPLSYYALILGLNSLNIYVYQLDTFGDLVFLQKISHPLLNTNRISNYASLFLVLPALYLFLPKIEFKKKVLFLLIFVFIILILVMSYSRGAFISIFVNLLVYLIIFFQLKNIKFIILSLIFLSQFLPIMIFLITKLGYNFFLNYNEWSAGRIELWIQFLEIFSNLSFKEKLIGLGIGEQNFFISYSNENMSQVLINFIKDTDGSFIHPHSLLLSVLIYLGVLGVVLFLIFTIFIFRSIYLASNYFVVYSVSFLIFFIHNFFDSLENTLSLIIILVHFFRFFFKNKILYVKYESKTFKIIFYFIIIFLFIRAFHWLEYHHEFDVQKSTWKDVRSCQFAYVPNITKIQKQYKPESGWNIFLFPEFRRSQENFLYALKYYKKFPSLENYNLLEDILQICLRSHFQPILCKFYEKNKIVMTLDYFDYFKEPLKYPESELLKCFRE